MIRSAQRTRLVFSCVALCVALLPAAMVPAQPARLRIPTRMSTTTRVDPQPLTRGRPALRGDLGAWSRRIDTSIPAAQRFFDQGMRLYYAAERADAVASFREAQRRDPACRMCQWGEAFAWAPSLDVESHPSADSAAQRALTRALDGLVPTDPAAPWIRALSARVLPRTGVAPGTRESNYADAMRRLALEDSTDPDVLTLAADALMQRAPRRYWNDDGTPTPTTAEAAAWLERAMELAPAHPGACARYIRLMEAERPSRALSCAERLTTRMRGAGHLVQLPAHIYLRTGRMADALAVLLRAVQVDSNALRQGDVAHTRARLAAHHHDMLGRTAALAGMRTLAMASTAEAERLVTPALAREHPALEPLLVARAQTLVQFNDWGAVLRAALPDGAFPVARALALHARGVAFASTHRHMEARATLDSLRAMLARWPVQDARRDLVQIAALVVEGEDAFYASQFTRAATAFRKAVVLEDAGAAFEPDGWRPSVRHALGDALLHAGAAVEAEQVFREDLARIPENARGLNGLARALRAQGKHEDARDAELRFRDAWRGADVPWKERRL
jgi:tetratricopeptide (TPR) repeat protein